MAQYDFGTIDPNTTSGTDLATLLGNWRTAINSMHSGTSRPAYAAAGTMWRDTTGSPELIKLYNGTNDLVLGAVDATSHIWMPTIGGGIANIASSATTNLGSSNAGYLTITGTITITSFGSSAPVGAWKAIKFAGALTLTNSANLALPTNASILTVANDQALAVHLGSGAWVVMGYQRADGTALAAASSFTSAVFFNSVITPTALSGSENNWNPTGLATANVIRLAASVASVQVTGLTAPGTPGKIMFLHNVGAEDVLLPANSASSSSANRWGFVQNVLLRAGAGMMVWYDSTSGLWRQMSVPRRKAPTYTVLDSGSGATYNRKFGCTRIEGFMVGAGGGGGGTSAGSGAAGGDTIFGTITAKGGGAGSAAGVTSAGGTGGGGTADLRVAGGRGGTHSTTQNSFTGGSGGAAAFYGGGGIPVIGSNGQDGTAPGAGGAGAGTGSGSGGGGGSGGEYARFSINDPDASYSYTVGAGGAGSTAGNDGGDGFRGEIVLKEFYD